MTCAALVHNKVGRPCIVTLRLCCNELVAHICSSCASPLPQLLVHAAYKGSSDLFIDSNLQLALSAAKLVSDSI